MNVLLLDRDGTVIIDPPDERVDSLEKIRLFADTIEALKYLADNQFEVVFITNQAGIAENRLSDDQFWEFHAHLLKLLSPSGIKILKTYMNPEAAGPNASQWRKPGPKMLFEAAKDFDLDLSKIYMVGDRDSDIHAAINAGCKGGILVETSIRPIVSEGAIFTAGDLMEAARYVVQNSSAI
jgi:histidinol-phosphate phosphatase family protein